MSRRFGLGLLLADALSGWRSRMDTRKEDLSSLSFSSFPSLSSGVSYRGVDSVLSSWRTLRRFEGGAVTGTSATDVSSSAMGAMRLTWGAVSSSSLKRVDGVGWSGIQGGYRGGIVLVVQDGSLVQKASASMMHC